MEQWSYGTTVSIFMRLPDGNTDGLGFSSTGFQSLAKLRDGSISSIAAVDGSATYGSWQGLELTIGANVTTYTMDDATKTIGCPGFNRARQSFEGQNCKGGADHWDYLARADTVCNS